MGRLSLEERQQRELLLRAGEVAAVFRVDPKTPARWARAGRITSVLSPGGHHLFLREHILAMVGADVLEGRDRLLRPDEVARIFRVDSKTPVRWSTEGKLSSLRTPSDHHRFRESDVLSYLEIYKKEAKA